VKFIISLLRKSNDSNTILVDVRNVTIIVDVRRRAACSKIFEDEYQAIIRAAKYGEFTNRVMKNFANKPCMQGKCTPLEELIIEGGDIGRLKEVTSTGGHTFWMENDDSLKRKRSVKRKWKRGRRRVKKVMKFMSKKQIKNKVNKPIRNLNNSVHDFQRQNFISNIHDFIRETANFERERVTKFMKFINKKLICKTKKQLKDKANIESIREILEIKSKCDKNKTFDLSNECACQGICQENLMDLWSFKTKKSCKTTLCQSWLLEDTFSCEIFDQVKSMVLEKLGDINVLQHSTNMSNIGTNFWVSQLLCCKTALYAKLIEKEERSGGTISFVEFFIYLVRSDSFQCPASHTLQSGMKLVVSAKGSDAYDCDIIWRLGYRTILDSIASMVNKALVVETEREVLCPECMANSDPCKANVWKVDNNSVYEQMGPTVLCNSGHKVSTKMIYGWLGALSTTAHTYLRNDTPGKLTEELLESVVLIGLWDLNEGRIMCVGSGFVADSSAGLIITAAHVLYDFVEGSKVGPKYKGRTRAKVIIGTMKEGDTASFTYSAEIMTNTITNVDAVVLRITTKFNIPFQCPSFSFKPQPEIAINYGKFKYEEIKSLKLMKPRIDEQIRIIGFIQRGEGIWEQGNINNHTPSVFRGNVCSIKECVSPILQNDTDIFTTRSEITVECNSFPGQSGGPCVNQDGKVIGILTSMHPNNNGICYVAPISELQLLVSDAKERISLSDLFHPSFAI